MIKQVILDMENQYLQVKTQVAVSIADQHMLEKKWRRTMKPARIGCAKRKSRLDKSRMICRAALDRFQTRNGWRKLREQVTTRSAGRNTEGALVKLEQKLDEAKSKHDLLIARHRRSIALGKAARAQTAMGDNSKSATFDRLKDRCITPKPWPPPKSISSRRRREKLTRLDRDTEVDRLLADLKARRGLPEKLVEALQDRTYRQSHGVCAD